MDLIAALHARLAGDAPLAALLAVYRGQPAVFAEAVAPADARPPWLLLPGAVADEPEATQGLRLRRLRLQIRCLGSAAAGSLALDAVAMRVRSLLQAELEPAGARVLAQSCAGPVAVEGDRHSLERRLELRLLLDPTEEE